MAVGAAIISGIAAIGAGVSAKQGQDQAEGVARQQKRSSKRATIQAKKRSAEEERSKERISTRDAQRSRQQRAAFAANAGRGGTILTGLSGQAGAVPGGGKAQLGL